MITSLRSGSVGDAHQLGAHKLFIMDNDVNQFENLPIP